MGELKEVVLADLLRKKGYIRGPFGSALKRPEMKSEGIPVYEQQHAISNSREFRFFIDDTKFKELKRFQVEANDLVISCSGTVGKVTIIREDDPKGIISQALLILRADSKKVLPEYLKYFFTLYKGYNAIVSRSSGSVQVNISKREVIEQIPLLLPDLELQEKIVGVLKTIDDKIETNEKINRNLEEQALAIYYKMFVETQNENRITCRTEEFFDITIGKTPPRKEKEWFSENPADCVWISISDMGSCGTFINNCAEYLTQEAVEKFNVKVIPDNTVILSFKLTVGRIAITIGPTTTNEAIAHFNTGNGKIVEYLYCYLKAFDFGSLGSTSSIGTAVNSKTIKAMDFVVPVDDELQVFCDIARPMFEQLKKNQFENQRLIAMRDNLLPRLMSGELDVSDLEI